MTLLTKTRTLNRMLQKAAGQAVNFNEMSEVLRDTIHANVFVVSRKGKILGSAMETPTQSASFEEMIYHHKRFPTDYNKYLLKIEETTSNQDDNGSYYPFMDKVISLLESKYVTIVPIIGGGDRLGTLLISLADQEFVDDDLILAEYGSTIIGMEILRERADEIEITARSIAVVQVAVNSLSFSELEAVEHIFDELKSKEGLLIASKIADRAGITRSVIVNALRKLESAGVIETRSLGMKGTYIKVLNDQLMVEIDKSKI